jgi:shikimate dehydrogenase
MISGKAKLAGILGWPIGHSRSPRLHNYWLAEHKIDGAYLPFPVKPEHLGDVLRALPKLGIGGVNLTIPHKEAALGHLDHVEPEARLIGAVNTVIVGTGGLLFGSNTDVEGFRASVLASGAQLATDRPAIVLGSGGAARAVVAALAALGFPAIRIVNRTAARAALMIDSLKPLGPALTSVAWDDRAATLAGAGFLVNTTSLGMTGEPALDLDLSALPSDAAVADIVYAPLETPLLAAARARKLAAIDGLGMLLYQARPGFKAWFGVEPQVTPALRDYVLQALPGKAEAGSPSGSAEDEKRL